MGLTDFLQPVQEGLATYMELLDSDDQLQSDDEVLSQACRLAFSQVSEYIRRALIRADMDELYIDVTEEIYLRNIPLASTDLTVIDYDSGEELVSGNDYVVMGGRDPSTHIRLMSETRPKIFRVQYTGGYEVPEGAILEALIAQGAAMYRRRDLLGTGHAEGPQNAFRIVSDSGGIIKTVSQMLTHWVYYESVVDYKVS